MAQNQTIERKPRVWWTTSKDGNTKYTKYEYLPDDVKERLPQQDKGKLDYFDEPLQMHLHLDTKITADGTCLVYVKTKEEWEKWQQEHPSSQGKVFAKAKPPIKFVEYLFSRTELLNFIRTHQEYEYLGTTSIKTGVADQLVTIMGTRTIPPPDEKLDHGQELEE